MDIFLFTTNIQESDLDRLSALLAQTAGIEKWTIDLDDCDRVLRVVGEGICFSTLHNRLNDGGFNCKPML